MTRTLTTFVILALGTSYLLAQEAQQRIPAPRSVQCRNFVAIDENGGVQHYEDCTPTDGQIMRCEVINATDARGKVRKIQNCALVAPPAR